jgi:TonB family protein
VAAPAIATPTAPGPTDAAKAALAEIERRNRMMQALGAVPPGVTGKKPEPLEGQADGDPLGDASQAAAGDMYLALVVQALKRNYVVPTTISQKERLFLACRLRLFIQPDGKIARSEIEESSGNAMFDRAIESSIQKTTLPKPPKAFLDQYGAEGVGFEFKP